MGILDGILSTNNSGSQTATNQATTGAEQNKTENSKNTTTGASTVNQGTTSNTSSTGLQQTSAATGTVGHTVSNTSQQQTGTSSTQQTGTSNTQQTTQQQTGQTSASNAATTQASNTNTSALTQAVQQTSNLDAGSVAALQGLLQGLAGGGNVYGADTLAAINALGGTATNMAGQAGTAQSEIQRAGEAAVAAAQNTFDTTTTGQINQYAQNLGGTENSAVMAIRAKAAGDLATSLAGIRANTAVQGRQAATQESQAAAGVQQVVAQLLASFDSGKTQNSAAVAQLADALKGAVSSTTGSTTQTGATNTTGTSNTAQTGTSNTTQTGTSNTSQQTSATTDTQSSATSNTQSIVDALQNQQTLQNVGTSTNQTTNSSTAQITQQQQIQDLISAITGTTAGFENSTQGTKTDSNSTPGLLPAVLSLFS